MSPRPDNPSVPKTRTARRDMPFPASVVLLAALLAATGLSYGWGLSAHRIITETAAARLSGPEAAFFEAHLVEIRDRSLEPDTVLKEADSEERRRHYFELDDLGKPPFPEIPEDRGAAERRFGAKKIRRAGYLPWRIMEVLGRLEAAFRAGDTKEIVRWAGYLSHYVADAHQPLHLTSNYDGQKSCDAGIHAAFEREMIERDEPRFRRAMSSGSAAVEELADPFGSLLRDMRESYAMIDGILGADKSAMRALKTNGGDYFAVLEKRAGPIAENRMSAAANAVASFWHTAWVRAGKPDLNASPGDGAAGGREGKDAAGSTAKPSRRAAGPSDPPPRAGSGGAPR